MTNSLKKSENSLGSAFSFSMFEATSKYGSIAFFRFERNILNKMHMVINLVYDELFLMYK